MMTYTDLLNTYKVFTKNATTENETNGTEYINDSIRTIASLRSGRWKWLETFETVYTVSNRQAYAVPNRIRHVVDVMVQVGEANNTSAIWIPELIYDPVLWKRILSAKLGYGDVPRAVYIQDNTMYFSPIPQSNGNLIRVRGRLNLFDLGIADYTTGTIVTVPYTLTLTAVVASGDTSATLNAAFTLTSGTYLVTFSSGEQREVTLTNGATTCTWTDELTEAGTTSIVVETAQGGTIITGSGTSWATGMEGRKIKIANTSAANGGDGFWYTIDTVYSTTILSLTQKYQGDNISAGSATYTIGQVPPIPEAYQMAPIYRAAALYWEIKDDHKKAEMYWRKYDGGVEAGLTSNYGGILSQMMESEGSTIEGAYIPPTDFYGRISPNNPEPDVNSTSFT